MIGFSKRAGRVLATVATAGLIWFSGGAAASPFTPGNLVVYRVGTGATTLVTTGNPVFLDEYTPLGVPVQSIALPTAAGGAQKALLASGTAASDGYLTRSVDGNCLALPGYARDLVPTGSGALTGTTAAAVPRVVGRVMANGTIDTSTALGDASSGGNFRGAASADCNSFWVTGGAGVRYATPLGATTSTDITNALPAATRTVAMFGGQLYIVSNSTGSKGVSAVGAGAPTTAVQTVTRLPGLSDALTASNYSFFFADLNAGVSGNDTLYIADDTLGILKFSFDGSTWTAKGTVGAAADLYKGLTGKVNGSTVTLYAIRKTAAAAAGGGELVSITDASGYAGTLIATPTALPTAVSAATNQSLRGVALAPEVTVTSSAGANGTISPAGLQIAAGASKPEFNVIPDSGYAASVGGTCGGTLVGTTYTTSPLAVNCTVSATFTALPTYTVTPGVIGSGTISPNTPVSVVSGFTTDFTISADPGFSASVGGNCGGSLNLAGTTYTTNAVVADCSVIATFVATVNGACGAANGVATGVAPAANLCSDGTASAVTAAASQFTWTCNGFGGGTAASCAAPRTYTVTPSVVGGNGTATIPASGVVAYNAAGTVTITPNGGFATVTPVGGTCGGTLVGTTYTTNAITSDCTVIASFAQITYTMTPSAGANGTISPSTPQTVNAGTTKLFTVTPDAGYSASVGGSCGGSLVGTTYTTNAASANCSVDATFTALPTFTVTPVVTGSGSVSPANAQSGVLQNATVVFTPTPAPGYSVVMSGCGGKMSGSTFTTAPVTADCTVTASFSQKNILFVGNSYTFARVDPAMTFNAANVSDLTAAFNAQYPNGTNSWPWNGATCTGVPFSDGCFEQHPWGGVPGIFKALTVQAGLDYNVSFSTRNAATLRGHFLNTSNAVWDLRSNISSQKWDIVMVQGQSDEPLPANKSKNGNPASFKTYASQIAKYVHQGNGQATDLVTTEQAMYAAEGFGTSSSTTPRTIPPNFNANPSAKVFVMQNWSRPDMVEAHKCTVADYTSNDGAPLVDPTCAAGTNGSSGENNIFYTAKATTALNLNDITTDMNSSLSSLLTGSSQFSGVIPTGNAFQKAVDAGVVKNSNFYNNGTYDESGLINLWWLDRTHGSKYGSYVSALVHFARLTGQDPTQFGGSDGVAAGLTISSADAVMLQQMAKAAVVPGSPTGASASAGNGQVTVTFTAPVNLGGLDITSYSATCGSQSMTGTGSPIVVTGLPNGASVSCTVVATNSVGDSVPSAASSTVTPVTVPDAPVIGTAVPGDTTVAVAFAIPPSDGGSAILSYTATCGLQSNNGTASPITVSQLTNGVEVTCTVIATNAVGPGAASAPSNAVTPQAAQTISFPLVAAQTFAPSGTFTVAATASSLLTVSFASTTPIICGVSGSTVSMLSTGACTIRASQAGNAAFMAAANVEQTIMIQAPDIALSPPTIPDGTVGLSFTPQTLAATGGTGPYAFAVTTGALPAGLTLTGAGSLSGTPTTAGTFGFTVTATDSSSVSVGGPFTGTLSYSIVVSKGLPLTSVTANLNPTVVGQTVVFTAVVAAAGPAVTGTVNFLDGASVICSGMALTGTQAQCVTDTLPAGARSITAVYSGDSHYLDSTSAVLTQTVNASGTIVLTVARAGSGSGTVQGSPLGINCGADCSETYATPTPVSLLATPNAGSIFTGWSGACVGRAACELTMTSSASVTATFAPAATALNLDVDDNRLYFAQSDGLIIVRYLFGLRGSALTGDVLGDGATFTDPVQIAQRLDNVRPLLDVDGNGRADALTDGLLLLRYLLGLRGTALISGAVGTGATRATFEHVEEYLRSISPALP